MKERIVKVALLIYIVVQMLAMVYLMILEIQVVRGDSEYRYHYLLIIYIVIPVLIIGGIIEYFGFKVILKEHSILMLFPFIIAMGFLLAMSSGGSSDPIVVSYVVTSIELIAILMFIYSLLELIEKKTNM